MNFESNTGQISSPARFDVDCNLYKKFWSLQDYFRNPNQCYNKIPWKTFCSVSPQTPPPVYASTTWNWSFQLSTAHQRRPIRILNNQIGREEECVEELRRIHGHLDEFRCCGPGGRAAVLCQVLDEPQPPGASVGRLELPAIRPPSIPYHVPVPGRSGQVQTVSGTLAGKSVAESEKETSPSLAGTLRSWRKSNQHGWWKRSNEFIDYWRTLHLREPPLRMPSATSSKWVAALPVDLFAERERESLLRWTFLDGCLTVCHLSVNSSVKNCGVIGRMKDAPNSAPLPRPTLVPKMDRWLMVTGRRPASSLRNRDAWNGRSVIRFTTPIRRPSASLASKSTWI